MCFIGPNGTGKSTLVEALAALAGFGEAGGSRDHGAVSRAAREGSGGDLAGQLRAGWLPKVAAGWFFRAETFFSVARYLDDVGSTSADFLSHSHGEGYLRVFSERMNRQGIYFMDEPESALSPKRQVELLRFLAEVQQSARAQVIMATHSPLLMAVPGAALWRMTPRGIDLYAYRDTDHFRLWQNFTVDPEDFVARALAGDDAGLV